MHYKDKIPRNDKKQLHGWIERYHPNGQLYHKGLYVNHKRHGLHEIFSPYGKLLNKTYFINGQRHGYYEDHQTSKIIENYYAR
jgi:antitoxin component YwqK of YwqJK toxin-antitoxin module